MTALRRGYALRRRPAVLWAAAGILLVVAHLGAQWLPNFRIPAAGFGRDQYVDCCLMFRYPADDQLSFDSVFEHGAACLALLIAALGMSTAARRGVALAVGLTLASDLGWTFLYADDQALPAYWAKLGCVGALLVFAVVRQRRPQRPLDAPAAHLAVVALDRPGW
jgi:hypothetical protein